MAKSKGERIKAAKERNPVEAYLRERGRRSPISWSERPENLHLGDKPDALVTLASGQDLGIEVVEVTDPESAKPYYAEWTFAAELRDLLNLQPGGGLVRVETRGHPPLELAEFRRAVVTGLADAIRQAGGLPALLDALPGKCWEHRWTDPAGGRKVVISLTFSPLARRATWGLNKFGPLGQAPSTASTAIETRIIEEVGKKAQKAAGYRPTPGGLHVLVLNQGQPVEPSATLKVAVGAAIAGSLITEVWLLNWDINVLDAEPPEPYLIRLG